MYTLKLSYLPYIGESLVLNQDNFSAVQPTSYAEFKCNNIRFGSNGSFVVVVDTGTLSVVGTTFSNYVQTGYMFDFIRTGAINFCELTDNEGTTTYYQINDCRYVSANRFEISCLNTLYNVYGASNFNFTSVGVIPAQNPFIERGYAFDSLLTGSTSVSCRWDKNALTDMYATSPFDININQLEGRLKLKWKEVDTAAGVMLDFCKKPKAWLNVYVNTGVEYTFSGSNNLTRKVKFGDTPVSNGKLEDITTNYPSLPYAILTLPIFEGTEALYLPTPPEFEGTGYSAWCNAYGAQALVSQIAKMVGESHIYQISVTPYAPCKLYGTMGGTGTSYQYTPTSGSYGIPSDYDVIPLGRYPDNDGFNMCCLKANYVDISPRLSIPVERAELSTIAIEYNTMFDYNLSASTLSTSSNPYILFNTRKIVLSDISGNKFDVDLMKIGRINPNLVFKSTSGFDIGANNYAVWLDTSTLPYNTFASNYSGYTNDIVKNGYGLIASAVNGYTYSVNQLESFLANNQNYYVTRNATEKLARTENILNATFGIIQGLTQVATGVSTANPVAVTGGITKTGSSALSGVLKEQSIQLTRQNSDRHLADLGNAPESLLSTNSVLFQTAIQQMGFYLSFYKASNRDINNLINDFIVYGLPVNKYVSTAECRKYITFTNSKFDLTNYKYVKGTISLTGNWGTGVGFNNQAANIWSGAVRRGLEMYKLSSNIIDGSANNSSVDSMPKEVFNAWVN